jgi:hypothetical protein
LDPQDVISSLNSREKKGDSAPPGREREFSCAVIHAGPKSGVTNSKKIKKMQNLRVASFYVT